MRSKQKRTKYNLLQTVISFLLMTNLLLPGLPTNVSAQKPQLDDAFKMSGQKVNLTTLVNKTASKMAIRSFSRAETRAQNSSGVAKSKSAQSEMYYVALNLEFTTPAARQAVFSDARVSKVKNAFPITVFDRFADIFVTAVAAGGDNFRMSPEAVTALYNNPNILRIESEGLVEAPPPPETRPGVQSLGIPEPIIRGGYRKNGMNLTGKNVIIAVLDTGIDFRHPDFITYDANGRPTSRIAYLWDTSLEYQAGRGSLAPFKFPNNASIGTLFTKDQLTNELRAANPTIPPTDLDGHGTACAGIAAGNGNADKRTGGLSRQEVEGVAPDAEIIGIRLGYKNLENGYLLNAMAEWLDKVAGTKPLVISGSFGGHYTGHDGQSVQERHLNARFPLTKAGRALVFAAGNEGNDGIHASVKFAKEPKLVSWNAAEATTIRIYFNSGSRSIQLRPTNATPLSRDNVSVEINPLTKQLSAVIDVGPGKGAIWLENIAGQQTEAHLYFYDEEWGVFSADSVSYSHLVGAPGSTENAITVGSFDWNDNFREAASPILQSYCGSRNGYRQINIGSLSCYSSPGPNRTGTIKPEIVAPGQWFSASYARMRNSAGEWVGVPRWQVDSTTNYAAMNGTSAATPYTSGIIALMFEKKPTLTLGEIRSHFKGKASKDGLAPFSADAIPNNNWGYGKLDMKAIDRIFSAL